MDRFRDEPHQDVELGEPEGDLDCAGEDRRDQQILQTIGVDERGGDERDGACRAGYHRGASAGERDDDADHEGCEQADFGIDAGDEREGDDLGDQREGADHAGENVTARSRRAAEPFGPVPRK